MHTVSEYLGRSAEIQYYRRCLAAFGIGFGTVAVLLFPTVFLIGAAYLAVLGLELLFLAPFAGYYLLRIFELRRSPQAYIFVPATLVEPRGGFRGMMYFFAEYEDETGRPRRLETRAIFAVGAFGKPNFEDYNGKRVMLGYNTETEEVIVCRMNEEEKK